MKKQIIPIILLLVLCTLSACGREESVEQTQFDDTEINITIGDTVVTAWLDDSETLRQFIELLPQDISMTRGRERVYYGGINNGSLTYNDGDIRTEAVSGDLAYNNSI